MERGKLKRDAFMREIVDMTEHIVGQAKGHEGDTIPGDFGALTSRCPKCGGEIHENYKKFQCQACDFAFWKIMGGRQLELTEADTLLRERSVGPLEGFRSRLGRPFTASIKLNDANEVTFDFGDGASDDAAEAPDFTGLEPLGACPKCGSRVFELPQAYVCEKAVGPEKTCDFRSGRVILQRPVERAQMQKLLATGKTDLLQFVSRFSSASPTARSGSSSKRRSRARAARDVRARPSRCACSARIRATRSRWNCTPAATARM
jgi:DNA topoisomerase-3